MTKLVREVMARAPLTIDVATSIEAAAEVMRRRDVGEIYVTDDGYLHGLLTARDIAVWSIAAGRHPGTISAGECCDHGQHRVAADASAEEALELMHRYDLQRLPVTDGDRLVGTVWITDVSVASRALSRATTRSRPPTDLARARSSRATGVRVRRDSQPASRP